MCIFALLNRAEMCYNIKKGVNQVSVPRAKRAANNKWDAENMKNIACKIKKEEAEAFKEYAAERKTTPNALLRNFIYKCIGKNKEENGE